MKCWKMQQIYSIIIPVVAFIIFLFSFLFLIALFTYPPPPPPSNNNNNNNNNNNTNITTTTTTTTTTSTIITIATSQPKSSSTTMTTTTRLDWTATIPIVTNTTQPDLSTATLFNNSNILFLVNSTTICDDELNCISMSEKPYNQNKIINIGFFSSSDKKHANITFNITRDLKKILGKIEFKEIAENNNESPKNDSNNNKVAPGCQPRKIYISWANVRIYLVRNRIASIPGTWIGEPLKVLRCRNFLDPCGHGQYCSVEMEERRETVMEISLKDGQKVANLTVYYVQDKTCDCAFTEPIIEDINSPPYIYNATVIRI